MPRLLALILYVGLTACNNESTPDAPSSSSEGSSADDNEDVEINRQDAKRLRRLAQQMEAAFDRILDNKKTDAFSNRKEEAKSSESEPETPPFTTTVKDFQVMTPWMKAMRSDNTFVPTKEDTTQNRNRTWGAALTVEIRNDTDKVLLLPDFDFGLQVDTEYGKRACTKSTRGRWDWKNIGNQQRTPKRPWAAETKDFESLWRPGEVIRRRLVSTCSNAVLYDTGIKGAIVVLDISAPHLLSNTLDDVKPTEMNDAVRIELPTDALTLRKVTLPSGEGYAFGSGTISFAKGTTVRSVLNVAGMRPDGSGFASLPDKPSNISLTKNELSITMDDFALTHWSDIPTAKKGSREFKVAITQNIDSSGIKARLNTALSAAKKKAADATAAADAAKKALAAATPEGAAAAKKTAAAATKAAGAAKKAASAAQKTYNTGLAKARGALAATLACDRVRLITPTRDLLPANAKEAKAACAALGKGDQAKTVLRYNLSRYEVPVGLNYNMGKTAQISWIASQATTRWDAR